MKGGSGEGEGEVKEVSGSTRGFGEREEWRSAVFMYKATILVDHVFLVVGLVVWEGGVEEVSLEAGVGDVGRVLRVKKTKLRLTVTVRGGRE